MNPLKSTLACIGSDKANATSGASSPVAQRVSMMAVYPTVHSMLRRGEASKIAGGPLPPPEAGAAKGGKGKQRSRKVVPASDCHSEVVFDAKSWTASANSDVLYTLSRILGLSSNTPPVDTRKKRKKKVASDNGTRGGLNACATGVVGDLVDRLGEYVQKLSIVETQEAVSYNSALCNEQLAGGSRSSLSPKHTVADRKAVAFAEKSTPSVDSEQRGPSLEWVPVFATNPENSMAQPSRKSGVALPQSNCFCVSSVYASCAALSMV